MAAISIWMYKIQARRRCQLHIHCATSCSELQNAWKQWNAAAWRNINLDQLPSRNGNYSWVSKDNSPTSRLRRLAAACQTLGYLLEHHSPAMNHDTELVDGDYPRSCIVPQHHILEPSGGTVMENAVQQARSGARVAAINAASAHQVGGGFMTGGRHALEEAMCMQSDLFFSLQQAESLAIRQSFDIHIPTYGAVLSRRVKVFRHGTEQGYRSFEAAPVEISVLSVSMPNLNRAVQDSPQDQGDANTRWTLFSRKWDAVLKGAMSTGARILIIPDAGCGVFQNDSREVGAALGYVLRRYAEAGCFKKVIVTGSPGFYHAVFNQLHEGHILPHPASGNHQLHFRRIKAEQSIRRPTEQHAYSAGAYRPVAICDNDNKGDLRSRDRYHCCCLQ